MRARARASAVGACVTRASAGGGGRTGDTLLVVVVARAVGEARAGRLVDEDEVGVLVPRERVLDRRVARRVDRARAVLAEERDLWMGMEGSGERARATRDQLGVQRRRTSDEQPGPPVSHSTVGAVSGDVRAAKCQ
jgi:hypothetical protein